VDLELFDDVSHMPLDGVVRDDETIGHRGCVQAVSEQVQDLELAGRERCEKPGSFTCFASADPLPGDGLGEKSGRNEHLTARRQADGFDDLL
jgi:hypothetical protein